MENFAKGEIRIKKTDEINVGSVCRVLHKIPFKYLQTGKSKQTKGHLYSNVIKEIETNCWKLKINNDDKFFKVITV